MRTNGRACVSDISFIRWMRLKPKSECPVIVSVCLLLAVLSQVLDL